MGAHITKLPPVDQRKRSHSIQNEFLLGTLRMIFHIETAQKAFLSFIQEEIRKRRYGRNFFSTMKYLDVFDQLDSESDREALLDDIGLKFSCFQNYSDYSHLIHNDPASSVDFLRKLQRSERYLMVLSVICVLNDFMRSVWHTVWQEIEMQSADPAPQVFPSVHGRIYDKFSSYDNELQYFLKTTEAKNVSDLLVCCLKHLPFPLVVMAMNSEQKWFPITSANDAFEELTGYTEDEVKGLNVKVLNPDPNAVSLMRSEMLEGEVSRFILPFSRKDGEVLTCVLGVIPIFDDDHSITSFVALLDDISTGCSLTRLKIFSDLVDSISSDINIMPLHPCDTMNEGKIDSSQAGLLI